MLRGNPPGTPSPFGVKEWFYFEKEQGKGKWKKDASVRLFQLPDFLKMDISYWNTLTKESERQKQVQLEDEKDSKSELVLSSDVVSNTRIIHQRHTSFLTIRKFGIIISNTHEAKNHLVLQSQPVCSSNVIIDSNALSIQNYVFTAVKAHAAAKLQVLRSWL